AAIRPGQTGIQAAYRTQAAVHQSRRSVTSTTRRAGSQKIRNQALPAATASSGPQLTHPQPPRLNSYGCWPWRGLRGHRKAACWGGPGGREVAVLGVAGEMASVVGTGVVGPGVRAGGAVVADREVGDLGV